VNIGICSLWVEVYSESHLKVAHASVEASVVAGLPHSQTQIIVLISIVKGSSISRASLGHPQSRLASPWSAAF